jgi:tRNA(fMet)-specific endonuclease VapC
VICLDTDVLSVFLRRGAPPAAQRRLAAVTAEHHFTTVITLAELLYGALKRGRGPLLAAIERYVGGEVEILPLDYAAARAYGEIRASLELARQPLDHPDLQIAAICLAHDLTLVTGNTRHFERVAGLHVENWLE